MSREPNMMIYRVVGVYMMLMAVLNLAVQFQVFDADTGQPSNVAEEEVGVDSGLAQTPETRVQQSVGGMTTPMGMMNAAHAPVMFIIGLMILLGRRWEMFAVIAIVVDALVKGGNILSHLAVGNGIAPSLVSVVIIIIDIILAVLMYREWQARKDYESTSYRGERAQVR